MALHSVSNSSFDHNNKIIDNLDANDFVYLEKDLDYYEKVEFIRGVHKFIFCS